MKFRKRKGGSENLVAARCHVDQSRNFAASISIFDSGKIFAETHPQCHGDLRGQNILKNMGYVWGTVNPNSHVLMFFCSVFLSRAQKAFALGTRSTTIHFSLSERARKFTKSGCPPFSSRRLCAELRVPKELILRPENSPKKSTRRRRVRMF